MSSPTVGATAERLLEAGRDELRAVGAETLTIRTAAQRAGVSPATAYTYLASKNRLYAELFWRFLLEDADVRPDGADSVARIRWVTRRRSSRSAVGGTTASAPTWPGSRRGSRSPRSSSGPGRSRSTTTPCRRVHSVNVRGFAVAPMTVVPR